MNPFISKLNEKNLCTWYILPLISLNPHSFLESNMKDSYLVRDKMLIAVHVADLNLCRKVLSHPNYVETQMKDETELLVFNIPAAWEKDYLRFLRGSYSKLSAYAKDKIRESSGLKYETPDKKGNKITDAILMALDKHPVLREKWYEILGSDAHLPEELLSTPRPESFITL